MIEVSCHCGSVKIDIPRKPRTLTDCNCSICRGSSWTNATPAHAAVLTLSYRATEPAGHTAAPHSNMKDS